tara:strand:+ start:478 stop:912 length:435 start_codon:yes stop_codon:yes gene_type:complete
MSARENIAKNLVTTLKDVTEPVKICYVTREPFEFSQLSNAQFPAVLVSTTTENREDQTIGGSLTKRSGSINYELVCYVKDKAIDTAKNKLIEGIEEKLDVDRTRGGNALDTQVISIQTDDGSIDPVGGVIITVQCLYRFTRGTA